MVLQQLNAQNQVAVQTLMNNNAQLLQSNQSASTLFNTAMQQLNNIQQNTTMNAATKQQNINQTIQMLQAGVNMQGSISNLNLGGTLNFAAAPALGNVKTATGAAPVVAPAAKPPVAAANTTAQVAAATPGLQQVPAGTPGARKLVGKPGWWL